jgi:RNA polymerase sigma-70 factor (ECF subfamily)
MVATTEQRIVPAGITASSTDEELFLRYRDQGDLAAFESLVHRYEKPLYNYLLRYVRSAPLAEEVFQATFLRIHQKRDQYSSERKLRPWIYSVATHLAVDALRREGRHAAVSLSERHAGENGHATTLLNMLESATATPPQRAITQERAQWTRRAVDALPDHERVAVLLIFFQGLKYREAADALQVPISTVKSRMHKALLTLNRAWQRDHRGE